jgi:hypothetical protein
MSKATQTNENNGQNKIVGNANVLVCVFKDPLTFLRGGIYVESDRNVYLKALSIAKII